MDVPSPKAQAQKAQVVSSDTCRPVAVAGCPGGNLRSPAGNMSNTEETLRHRLPGVNHGLPEL
jgi:hypothetical protein